MSSAVFQTTHLFAMIVPSPRLSVLLKVELGRAVGRRDVLVCLQ
jgi:hypothetical protein